VYKKSAKIINGKDDARIYVQAKSGAEKVLYKEK
jgi:hypothetical protein